MKPRAFFAAFLLASLCGAAGPEAFNWHLPKGFPKPVVPADNPMTEAKVELGRYLFYDVRMSVNDSQSCASCHKQELAFTDGLPVAVGATGQHHPRSAMCLVNVAYNSVLTWNDASKRELEQQALVPMFGDHPVELGLHQGDHFFAMLPHDGRYQRLFTAAFPADANSYTVANVVKALACFERSIISARSPYDRYHYDRDDSAISESAKHGEVLFFSQPLNCFRCHGGFNFNDNSTSAGHEPDEVEFHNTALYAEQGKFKAPTLRNIATTAPYMHDGSIPTLDGVLDHYAAGGRAGHNNPTKDLLITGFALSPHDRKDLIEFLKTLTDEEVLHDPRFSNPWH